MTAVATWSNPPAPRSTTCSSSTTEFNGDWLLAIAAYNSGELNVHRAVQENLKHKRPTDFWHLNLPKETRAYVPKLLAMRRIVADPGAVRTRVLHHPE